MNKKFLLFAVLMIAAFVFLPAPSKAQIATVNDCYVAVGSDPYADPEFGGAVSRTYLYCPNHRFWNAVFAVPQLPDGCFGNYEGRQEGLFYESLQFSRTENMRGYQGEMSRTYYRGNPYVNFPEAEKYCIVPGSTHACPAGGSFPRSGASCVSANLYIGGLRQDYRQTCYEEYGSSDCSPYEMLYSKTRVTSETVARDLGEVTDDYGFFDPNGGRTHSYAVFITVVEDRYGQPVPAYGMMSYNLFGTPPQPLLSSNVIQQNVCAIKKNIRECNLWGGDCNGYTEYEIAADPSICNTVPVPTVTVDFEPDAVSINSQTNSCNTTRITWSSTNADQVSFSCSGNLGSGLIPQLSGSLVIAPTQSQTCILTARNTQTGRTATSSATITVNCPGNNNTQASCNISFSPSSIKAGESTTINWSSSGDADGSLPYTCFDTEGNVVAASSIDASGQLVATNVNLSLSCSLVAQPSSGSPSTCSASLTVDGNPSGSPTPTPTPQQTHSECVAGACVVVNGPGADNCPNNCQSGGGDKMCFLIACVNRPAGFNGGASCSTPQDCGAPPPPPPGAQLYCSNGQSGSCSLTYDQLTPGLMYSQCSIDADCGNVPPPPPPPPQPELIICPSLGHLQVGQTMQFTARYNPFGPAICPDIIRGIGGRGQDVTDEASWSVPVGSQYASVNNSSQKGLVRALQSNQTLMPSGFAIYDNTTLFARYNFTDAYARLEIEGKIPDCTLTANPSNINLPQTAVLNWDCNQNADSCTIDKINRQVCNSPASCNAGGNIGIAPTSTTVYTMTCDCADCTSPSTSTTTVTVGGSGGEVIKEIIPTVIRTLGEVFKEFFTR